MGVALVITIYRPCKVGPACRYRGNCVIRNCHYDAVQFLCSVLSNSLLGEKFSLFAALGICNHCGGFAGFFATVAAAPDNFPVGRELQRSVPVPLSDTAYAS